MSANQNDRHPLLRRVVTGVRDGKSVLLSDGPPANAHEYQGWPGHMTSVVWATAPVPDLPREPGVEPAPAGMRVTPGPGETRLMIVRLPPDAVFADPRFDPVGLDRELTRHLDGLHKCFERDAPGMHRTDSLDYDIVLHGEIWLELDDGVEVHLHQGDVVVQGGARHAWRNRSDRSTTMAFILIGTPPA
jgi:quercetin dioxygenase-like cupin family protein